MSKDNNGPVAVVNWPQLNKDLIPFAKNIYDAWNQNPKFPNPSPTLALFQSDLQAYTDAEAKAATRGKGLAKLRNAKRSKVRSNIKHWCDYAQGLAEAAPGEAEAIDIITSAGFSVRQSPKWMKPELDARSTGVSGDVQLDAKAVRGALVYYFEFSDDQVTWHPLPETHRARTVASGLTPLRFYYFRFRVFTRKGKLDYSQVIRFLVQ